RVDAIALDRVPVGHHHYRYPRVGHGGDGAEDVGGAYPGAQRGIAGPLDHRTVQDRVGVRHAHLYQVDTGRHHRPDRADRAVDAGKTGRQVPDEHAAPVGTGLLERWRDAHDWSPRMPKYFPAVSTSLSPRPERFTRMVASGPSSRATRRAPARACALSI